MRKTTSGDVTIQYPDEIGFAFNPCLVIARGVGVSKMEITAGGKSMEVAAHGNEVYADFRELVQSAFDGFIPTINYNTNQGETDLSADLTVEVIVNLERGGAIGVEFNTVFIWGAMYPGETFNGYRELTYFKGHPFALSAYLHKGSAGTLLIKNDGTPTSLVEIGEYGIWYFTIPNATAKRYYEVWDMDGTFAQTTFDDTFDLTFRMSFNGKQTRLMRINVCDCHFEHPVYLRWVDRHGFWCHWLFKQGEESRAMDAVGEYMRNNLLAWDSSYGYRGTAGRRQTYTREDSMAVCAPLVNSDTFDMLQDLTTSPYVDMYMPDTGKWISVTVKDGTYKKTTADLQDFTCTIVKQQYNIQAL